MMNLLADCRGKTLANDLKWLNEPPQWQITDGALDITPAAPSDFFRPFEGNRRDNCCLLYKDVTGDFTAVACAKADLADFGDAAAVTVRASETQWAKVCVERNPIGDVSLVSVVTDPWSDDSNSELLSSPECFMRLTRKGSMFGMHYSLDGTVWRFVRAFAMELPSAVKVGIHAQAPFTPGCHVRFRSFSISPQPVADLRSGE